MRDEGEMREEGGRGDWIARYGLLINFFRIQK
jgi:hypothetical protein